MRFRKKKTHVIGPSVFCFVLVILVIRALSFSIISTLELSSCGINSWGFDPSYTNDVKPIIKLNRVWNPIFQCRLGRFNEEIYRKRIKEERLIDKEEEPNEKHRDASLMCTPLSLLLSLTISLFHIIVNTYSYLNQRNVYIKLNALGSF